MLSPAIMVDRASALMSEVVIFFLLMIATLRSHKNGQRLCLQAEISKALIVTIFY